MDSMPQCLNGLFPKMSFHDGPTTPSNSKALSASSEALLVTSKVDKNDNALVASLILR